MSRLGGLSLVSASAARALAQGPYLRIIQGTDAQGVVALALGRFSLSPIRPPNTRPPIMGHGTTATAGQSSNCRSARPGCRSSVRGYDPAVAPRP